MSLVKTSVLLVIGISLIVSCGKSTSDSSSGYTFRQPALAISYAMMRVPADGSTTAGVDSAAMITPNGQVRLIFTGPNGVMKSALSNDGITFSLDNNFTSPFTLVGIGQQTIIASPTGGYKMFARSDTQVYSATSTDGAVWTQESGIRFDGASMGIGLTRITGPSVIKLPNGKYRGCISVRKLQIAASPAFQTRYTVPRHRINSTGRPIPACGLARMWIAVARINQAPSWNLTALLRIFII